MTVRKLSSFEELEAMFIPEAREDLRKLAQGARYIVVYQSLDLTSFWCGVRSALKVGPGCQVQSLAEALQGYIHEPAAGRLYPVAYWESPEAAKEVN
jgi:hypothetical protein